MLQEIYIVQEHTIYRKLYRKLKTIIFPPGSMIIRTVSSNQFKRPFSIQIIWILVMLNNILTASALCGTFTVA